MKDVITRNTSTTYEIIMSPEDAIDLAIVEAMTIKAANNPSSLGFMYKDGIATITVKKL
jgi:hypothetical protein